MKKVFLVVGTRPNFIKITQVKKLGQKFRNLEIKIIHTGQHFDDNMSKVFFEQFKIEPEVYLNAETGTPSKQIASIIERLDGFIQIERPDIILVPGDVNSTLATAIVANKNNITLGHIESGLRSFDNSMPEEHNRVLTDKISHHCFVTEPSGMDNLAQEASVANVHYVGNTMIDTMVAYEKEIDESNYFDSINLKSKDYILLTMHRPSNVDSKDGISFIAKLIQEISKTKNVVFPIHPRTLKKFEAFNNLEVLTNNSKVKIIEPLGYFQFQNLVKNAFCCVTDSGGIQEETTFARVPCLTLRPNTERPITILKGTNTLLPNDIEMVLKYIQSIEDKTYKKGDVPELWDGKATERILKVLDNI